jgi:hypothetical protein
MPILHGTCSACNRTAPVKMKDDGKAYCPSCRDGQRKNNLLTLFLIGLLLVVTAPVWIPIVGIALFFVFLSIGWLIGVLIFCLIIAAIQGIISFLSV